MKRIFTLRSLIAVCLATLCLLLPIQAAAATRQESPQATKSVATTTQWLEEGYTWTYTIRYNEEARKFFGREKVDDISKKYKVGKSH